MSYPIHFNYDKEITSLKEENEKLIELLKDCKKCFSAAGNDFDLVYATMVALDKVLEEK